MSGGGGGEDAVGLQRRAGFGGCFCGPTVYTRYGWIPIRRPTPDRPPAHRPMPQRMLRRTGSSGPPALVTSVAAVCLRSLLSQCTHMALTWGLTPPAICPCNTLTVRLRPVSVQPLSIACPHAALAGKLEWPCCAAQTPWAGGSPPHRIAQCKAHARHQCCRFGAPAQVAGHAWRALCRSAAHVTPRGHAHARWSYVGPGAGGFYAGQGGWQ